MRVRASEEEVAHSDVRAVTVCAVNVRSRSDKRIKKNTRIYSDLYFIYSTSTEERSHSLHYPAR